MFFGKRTHRDHDVVDDRGVSLARGPVLVLGTILLAYGLLGLLTNADFPRDQVTGGTVQGESWLGIEVNGWTNFFSIAAGGLLLFGAAQHMLARLMALLVGLALAACAVISIIDGEDVLGLAAANTWTKVAFAVSAALLLMAALLPRTGTRRETTFVAAGDRDRDHVAAAPAAGAGAATGAAAGAGIAGRDRDRDVVTEEPRIVSRDGEAPVGAGIGPADGDLPAGHRARHPLDEPEGATAVHEPATTADPAVRTGRFERTMGPARRGQGTGHAGVGGRMRRWLARH